MYLDKVMYLILKENKVLFSLWSCVNVMFILFDLIGFDKLFFEFLNLMIELVV